MDKRYLGLGLIALAFVLIKFITLNSLSTVNLAIIMGIGIISWIGMLMFISPFLPNPSGPNFSMWKMLLKGFIGFASFFAILMIGIADTNNYVTNELKDYGVTTKAVVIDRNSKKLPAKRGQVNYVYYVTVRFQDQNGEQQQVKSEVQEFEYSSAVSGRQVEITYSSRNPKIHELIFK